MGAAEFHPATSCIDQPKHQDGAAEQMEMENGVETTNQMIINHH